MASLSPETYIDCIIENANRLRTMTDCIHATSHHVYASIIEDLRKADADIEEILDDIEEIL